MTSPTFPPVAGISRLHWTFVHRGRTHVIDLAPAAAGSKVRVRLDGRQVATMTKPGLRNPWEEAWIVLDGSADVAVGLTSQPGEMATDVFLEGRSLVDGRDLPTVRAAAPRPWTEHEVWLLEQPHLRTDRQMSWVARGARGWIELASVLIWGFAIVASPLPENLRRIVPLLMLVGAVPLLLLPLRVLGAMAERAYHRTLRQGGSEATARSAYDRMLIVGPIGIIIGMFVLVGVFGSHSS